MCALHALRSFGEHGWQFFVPIALAMSFPGTLLPATAVQTSQTIGRLCLAPKVALWYAEQASPHNAFLMLLLVDLVAVASFGALLTCVATQLLQRLGRFALHIVLILAGMLSGIDASLNIVLGMVVSKNWTAELAQSALELTNANSMVTICELAVAAIAPLVISGISSSFGHAATTALLIFYQLTAAAGVMILSCSLGKNLTSLRLKAPPDSRARDPSQQRESLSLKCVLMKWRELSGDVRGAMLAMVVLFCTSLGGASAGLTSWFTLQGVSVARIAAWTSSMNFIGFVGASASPFAIRIFGPLRAAQIGQGWQMCFVLGGLVAFLTGSTGSFMVAIPLSRIGLWCFDLAERQMVQSAVPEYLLAPLFAAEASAQQCSFLLMLSVSLAFPQPSQFVILVVISASVTVVACIILNIAAQSNSAYASIDAATLLSLQNIEMEGLIS